MPVAPYLCFCKHYQTPYAAVCAIITHHMYYPDPLEGDPMGRITVEHHVTGAMLTLQQGCCPGAGVHCNGETLKQAPV